LSDLDNPIINSKIINIKSIPSTSLFKASTFSVQNKIDIIFTPWQKRKETELPEGENANLTSVGKVSVWYARPMG